MFFDLKSLKQKGESKMLKKVTLVFAVFIMLVFMACGDSSSKTTPVDDDDDDVITDPYPDSVYSSQPTIGIYSDYKVGEGGDIVELFGTTKSIITVDDLQFKDSDGDGELDVYEDWRKSPLERAEDLVSKMSIQEKIGLLSFNGQGGLGNPTKDLSGAYNWGVDGLNSDGTITDSSKAYSIVNNGVRYTNLRWSLDPIDELKWLTNVQGLAERCPWGIPYIIVGEPNHEFSTWNTGNYDESNLPTIKISPWPYHLGLGAIKDLAVTEEYGNILRTEHKMRGRTGLMGPIGDTASEPRWARVNACISSDSDVVESQLVALLNAIQGADLDDRDDTLIDPTNGVGCVLKHFPGAGPNEEGMDSHSWNGRNNNYPTDNFSNHVKPYKTAFQNTGTWNTMMCYSIINKDGDYSGTVPAAWDPEIISVLRDEIGYEGTNVSDGGTAGKYYGPLVDMTSEYTQAQRLGMMLEAGTNQALSSDYTADWTEAYIQGWITETRINESATQSLQMQFKIGLFENPYVKLADAEEFWAADGDALKARVASGKMAMKKAIVLCKNTKVNTETSENLVPIREKHSVDKDTDGDMNVEIYFDSMVTGYDSGEAASYASDTYYPLSSSSADALAGYSRSFVSDIADADVAIIRICARGGIYFGPKGGIPLSYDGITYIWDQTETGVGYTTDVDTTDTTLTGKGYRANEAGGVSKAKLEAAIAEKNGRDSSHPLYLIVIMQCARPGIIAPYIDDIDAFFVDFGATDDVVLDLLFYVDGFSPSAKLPIEIPSSDDDVAIQATDGEHDTANCTFDYGYGLSYEIADSPY